MHLKMINRKKRYLLMAAVAGMLAVPGFSGRVNAEETDTVVNEETAAGTEEENETVPGAGAVVNAEDGSEGETAVDAEEGSETETTVNAEEGSEAEATVNVEEGSEAETTVNAEEGSGIETAAKKEVAEEEETGNGSEAEMSPSDLSAVTDTTNGWQTDGGDTYYYVDGEMVKSTVMEIDGNLYAFRSNGKMYEDEPFTLATSGGYFYGRAKEGGRLYRSAWYLTNEEEPVWYYYGADGRGAKDLAKVGNKTYLFDGDGMLMARMCCKVGDTWYVGDENGYPIAMSGNGWKQYGGQWFYLTYNTPMISSVTQIGSKYYGFDYYGRMISNAKFQSRFGTSDVLQDFYATADGSLLCNSWYQSGRYWYYFGSNGAGVHGYQVINKTPYVFSNTGYMYTETTIAVTSGAGQGLYYTDKNGKATKVVEGWNRIGSDYIYVRDGRMVRSSVLEINGKLYAFNESGFMRKNELIYRSSTESLRAKASGELYRNAWYQGVDGEWYYYGDDGRAVTGIRKINGAYYAFDTKVSDKYGVAGVMATGGSMEDADGKLWIVGKNGRAYCPDDGWFQVDGIWYYSNEGTIARNEVRTVGGKLYGFDPQGRLYTNTRFQLNGSYYRSVDGSGTLIKGQWYGMEYYGDNYKAAKGKTRVNGKDYYFREGVAITEENIVLGDTTEMYYADKTGVLSLVTKNGVYFNGVARGFYYVENGELVKSEWRKLGGNYYFFDKNGYSVTYQLRKNGLYYYFRPDGTMMNGGWNYTRLGRVLYMKDSGEALTGVQKIGGKYYYFSTEGYMQTGICRIDGVNYFYDESGAYVGKLNDNGWTKLGELWFYAKDGIVAYDTELEIGGKYYCFDDKFGAMKSDYVDPYYGQIYGKNGARIMSGWVFTQNAWYYVDPENNEYVEWEYRINGKDYLFINGRMATSDYYPGYGDSYYRIASNGEIQNREYIKDGYYYHDGEQYLIKDGNSYTGWWGNRYYEYGVAVCNAIRDGYLLDGKGNWVKTEGVHSISDDGPDLSIWPWATHGTCYVKSNGTLASDEWIKLGGSWYYFEESGLLRTRSFIENFILYVLDPETGKMLKSVKNPADGWYPVGKSWIYVSAGSIIEKQFILKGKIYDTQYLENGVAATNMPTNYYYGDNSPYYFGNNGAAVTTYTGWKQINGHTYYFGTTGKAAQEWFTVGGHTYYSDLDTGIVTGWRVIDGILYNFNSSGQLTQQVTYENGWLKKGGEWYYYQNGSLYMDYLLWIGNKCYLMQYGKLVVNGAYFGYASDENGELLTNAWKKIGTNWYYCDAEGLMVTGTRMINGKLYYFSRSGVMQ